LQLIYISENNIYPYDTKKSQRNSCKNGSLLSQNCSVVDIEFGKCIRSIDR